MNQGMRMTDRTSNSGKVILPTAKKKAKKQKSELEQAD